MEQTPPTDPAVEITSTELVLPPKNKGATPKKKRSGINILKAALLLLRRRSAKQNAVDVASHGLWRRLVGSMRPLHLHLNRSPDRNSLPVAAPSPPPALSPVVEHYEDVLLSPFSPQAVKSSSSSVDSMSRYASAVNLQEMDQSDDDDSDDECYMDMNGGDELIDAKAEEFIAQFYAQMRIQRADPDQHYREMVNRSIG